MPRCTRDEIREASDAARKIHDDIRCGRALIHAPDGHTSTTVVGTYLDHHRTPIQTTIPWRKPAKQNQPRTQG
ncbi:hypothetical protein [Streptomyces sp. WG-D5]